MKIDKQGDLEWIVDDQGRDWFTVPNSNRHLLANQSGEFRHALTWFEFLVGWESEEPHAGYGHEFCDVSGWHRYKDIATVLAVGEDLFSLLIANGCPLWASDVAVIQQWMEDKAVTFIFGRREVCFEKIEDRDRRWKEADKERRRIRKAGAQAEQQRKALRRAEREAAGKRRAAMEASPEYIAMFERVYGKPFDRLNETDAKAIVYHARKVVEYRLNLERDQ